MFWDRTWLCSWDMELSSGSKLDLNGRVFLSLWEIFWFAILPDIHYRNKLIIEYAYINLYFL